MLTDEGEADDARWMLDYCDVDEMVADEGEAIGEVKLPRCGGVPMSAESSAAGIRQF